MLLSITTTHVPASDLGYLLHKNPAKAQRFDLAFGTAHVFYPEAGSGRCSAALLVDVDPIALIRNRRGPSGEGGLLDQYVNDRPYAASSFLSVAIGEVYRSAMAGRSKERPELAHASIPLELEVPVVPSRGGERLLRALFEPLGYEVQAHRLPLDEKFPDWGESAYFGMRLTAVKPLKEALTHLYVLLPVLDNDKHYWVGDDEVEKLVRHGKGWLAGHPEREQIARRYLKNQRSLAREALSRLLADETPADEELQAGLASKAAEREVNLERPLSLNERRIDEVVKVLRESEAASVLDLGCGEGKLLSVLLKNRSIRRVAGLDASIRALEIAQERLKLDRLPAAVRDKLKLLHGALTYRDRRLEGFDAAAVVEVIEHLDMGRLAAFERVLFEFARPRVVVVTTPNSEYNVKFPSLPAGQFRHADHRFEWTRAQFQAWATGVAARHGFSARFAAVGDEDPQYGAPTQMAVFELAQA
jgi:3' terminal RNA ribose 2'-O-methyltransferase Hen1